MDSGPTKHTEVNKILMKRPVVKTAFRLVHVGILKECCEHLHLKVNCSGKRGKAIGKDYTKALVDYVRDHRSW
jgi:hypothetical protein